MNATSEFASPAPSALILAAGRGERMRPLSDHTPKPLLLARGEPLMQWPLKALLRGGVRSIVINTAWLGSRIHDYFDDARIDAIRRELALPEPFTLSFSKEGEDFDHALGTAGGIARALPLLTQSSADLFWVASGDVYAPEFVFSSESVERFAASDKLAHLWLIPSPSHNLQGDFGLSDDGLALNDAPAGSKRLTFSSYALYRRALLEPPWCDIPAGNPNGIKQDLGALLRRAIEAKLVSAEYYDGMRIDVGTPERLAALNDTHTQADSLTENATERRRPPRR